MAREPRLGGGQDYEQGGGGGDTFVYDRGYGRLEINETQQTSTPDNVLQLGEGITAANVSVTADDDGNLCLTDGTTGDRIELDGEKWSASSGVQEVQFADGTTWTRVQLLAQLTVGTSGADTLSGSADGQIFDGRRALAGTEDYESSHSSGNTFIYKDGYGQLEIDETNFSSTPDNALQFGDGIVASDISVASDGTNLYLTDGTAGDRIKLDDALLGSDYGVQTVQFSDGSSLTRDQLIALSAAGGTTSADELDGTSSPEVFDGKGVSAGSEYVTGAAKDYESGGGGGDTFIFDPGYGELEIFESDTGATPENTLVLGAGISPEDVTVLEDSQGTIYLKDADPRDLIILDGEGNPASDGTTIGVQAVQFANGTVWTQAQLQTLASASGSASGTEAVDDEQDPALSLTFPLYLNVGTLQASFQGSSVSLSVDAVDNQGTISIDNTGGRLADTSANIENDGSLEFINPDGSGALTVDSVDVTNHGSLTGTLPGAVTLNCVNIDNYGQIIFSATGSVENIVSNNISSYGYLSLTDEGGSFSVKTDNLNVYTYASINYSGGSGDISADAFYIYGSMNINNVNGSTAISSQNFLSYSGLGSGLID